MARRISVVRPSDIFRVVEDSMTNMLNDIGFAPMASRTDIEVNAMEFSDRFEVHVKVPGFTKEEINLGFEDNMLVIEVNKSQTKEDSDNNEHGEYFIREFISENHRRVISLPSKVDTDKAEAELKNGIMKITIPKMPEMLPKKIHIKD